MDVGVGVVDGMVVVVFLQVLFRVSNEICMMGFWKSLFLMVLFVFGLNVIS